MAPTTDLTHLVGHSALNGHHGAVTGVDAEEALGDLRAHAEGTQVGGEGRDSRGKLAGGGAQN